MQNIGNQLYPFFYVKFANESKLLLSIIRRRFGDLDCHLLRFTRETKSQNNENFIQTENSRKNKKPFNLSFRVLKYISNYEFWTDS